MTECNANNIFITNPIINSPREKVFKPISLYSTKKGHKKSTKSYSNFYEKI